jgi:hypothetical protein
MMTLLKHQGAAMVIGVVSVLVAYWIERLIPQDMLDLLVLVILMTLSFVLWIHLRNLILAMGCSILSLHFHLYCGYCFVRQAALTFILAGCAISLWQGISQRKSKM